MTQAAVSPRPAVASGLRRVYERPRRIFAAVLTLVLAAATGAYAAKEGHTGLPLAVTLAAFVAFMLPYLLLVSSSFRRDVRGWLRRTGPRGLVAAVVYVNAVYLVYALGTGTLELDRWARLCAFVSVPCALVAWAGRDRRPPTWKDWLAIVAIWVPFDSRFLDAIWAWPAGEGAYILNTAIAVVLATSLFFGYRRVGGFNIRFTLNGREALLALGALVAFIVIALPFGLATGFLAINPQIDLLKGLVAPIGILLFIGLPEELLFRGLVQNLLTQQLGRPRLALVLASIFFGLTHYNNTPVPDWRYLTLATVAGLFYGSTYMRTRSLLAPALVHTLVDTIWMLFLHVTGWAQ